MRNLFTVAIVFMSLGLMLGFYLRGGSPTALAGGVDKCTTQNGDVNADGNIDLSDAVTILGNLFLGNPTELMGLCDPPELTARIAELEAELAACRAGHPASLPGTGQTKCYDIVDGNWTEVPCDQATCKGQDGAYAVGCPSEDRFVDNGDGTVTDTCSGLMWQKDTADVNGDGQIDDADQVNECGALAYCEGLKSASHDDWRLPNIRELQSIVDYGRLGPAIDPVFGAFSDHYWSSTPGVDDDSPPAQAAWYVNFIDGGVGRLGGSFFPFYVRAVRNAQ